jgi:hypothetical protein
MDSPITLVQGDNRPYITLTIWDDGEDQAVDLSGASIVPRLYIKSVDTDEVLTVIEMTKINSGTGGIVRFNFPGAALEIKPGLYLGFVEVDFAGEKQTSPKPLIFDVRRKYSTEDY